MYFLNIKKLKEELINSTLNQRSLVIYIFIYVVLMELLVEVESYFPDDDFNYYDYANSIAYLIIISAGTFLAYIFNGGIKGKEFAERYFSISFVVGIRFTLALFPVMVVLMLPIMEIDEEFNTDWYHVVIASILMSAYYWRCLVHIKYVANETKRA